MTTILTEFGATAGARAASSAGGAEAKEAFTAAEPVYKSMGRAPAHAR
jgi:hypothetical protein